MIDFILTPCYPTFKLIHTPPQAKSSKYCVYNKFSFNELKTGKMFPDFIKSSASADAEILYIKEV
jgi:hypothetical protein